MQMERYTRQVEQVEVGRTRILKPLHLFCDLHPLRLWTNLCGHNSSALCIDLRLRPRPAESVCESSVV